MAETNPDKLQDFSRRSPFKDVEGIDAQLWAAFVGTLQDLLNSSRTGGTSASVGGGGGGIPIGGGGSGTGVGSGGSTGTGGGTTANQTMDIAAATVANTIGASVGNFIYRSGQSIGLADNRDLSKQATDYVYATGPGIAYITPIYKAKNPTGTETNGKILLASGAGTNASAILYLYRDGTATDDIGQILNITTGRYVNDAKFVQQIAIRTGAPRTVFVTGDVNIHRPGTG